MLIKNPHKEYILTAIHSPYYYSSGQKQDILLAGNDKHTVIYTISKDSFVTFPFSLYMNEYFLIYDFEKPLNCSFMCESAIDYNNLGPDYKDGNLMWG